MSVVAAAAAITAFYRAIKEFAERYVAQNERDSERSLDAVPKGQISANTLTK
jgi:hypothetical protein